MKKYQKVLLFVLIAIFIAIAILAVKRKKSELSKAKAIEARPIPVTVANVREGVFRIEKLYVGIIKPLYSSDISSRITSTITKKYITEGQIVKKDDLLLKLDDRNLKQQISVLEAKKEGVKMDILSNNSKTKSLKNSVEYWKKQLERDKKLFKENILSAKSYELTAERLNETQGEYEVILQKDKALEASLKAIEGDIDLSKTQLSYSEIRAPFDGIICNIPIDVGDLAVPGKKLVEMENQNILVVSMHIPQVDMKYVKLDKEIMVACKGKEYKAKISKIYPALGESKMMHIEATLPKDSQNFLVSGQYVKASMPIKEFKNAFIVPSTALNIKKDNSKTNTLFVFNNGILKQEKVEIIGDNEIEAAVKGNITSGMKVVTGAFLGWAELADGMKAQLEK